MAKYTNVILNRSDNIKAISILLFLILALTVCASAWAHGSPPGYRTVTVDAGHVNGVIRDLQGVNGQPTPVLKGLPNLVRQYKELPISLVRTHDMMGPTDIDATFKFDNIWQKWLIPDPAVRKDAVEVGNKSIIFPNPKADPEQSLSYNFGPTDQVMDAIQHSGAKVFYRIGRSWGAEADPPADFDKYANVVKHVAMHYNKGWAKGFHYNIKYWEFWNEPGPIFWNSTPERFYELYEKTARALKSVDSDLKVGGPGLAESSQVSPYREGLMDYCREHKVPLDFYSWHTYAVGSADPYDGVRLGKRFRTLLDSHGFPKAESVLSEWNLSYDFTDAKKAELQGEHNAAFIAAVLTYLEDAPVNKAIFYRGDATWMGLFDLHGNYFKTAYTFKAMGQMLKTPQRLAVAGPDTNGFSVLAGRSVDGKTVQILISNYEIPKGFRFKEMYRTPEVQQRFNEIEAIKAANKTTGNKPPVVDELPQRTGIVYKDNAGYDLTVKNLRQHGYTVKRYRISKTKNLELVDQKVLNISTLRIKNELPLDSVELIILRQY
jgi:hypothetical protein